MIPQIPVNKFLEHVEARAWTDAEKELDIIRQKSDNSQWSRGYVKALEGLMLTYRTNDDKYIFLPKVLASRTEDTDRKSTRLNSSHSSISYAVFCLKKKNNN